MESKAILFHSNKKEECKKFITQKDYLIVSKNENDNIWLGTGMYFWDNIGNANWWNKKQTNRNPNNEYHIISANVKLDDLLDLTDFDIYMKLEELWKHIYKKMNMDLDIPLGNKLDYLFAELKFPYSAIKVYGKYKYTPNKGFFSFDYDSAKAEPTMASKCIYNIKNSDCIIEKEYIREGKENDKERKLRFFTELY